ncbi:mycofactocin system GMC family oxidoreductase MftG [Williamsia sp.]|uniref:mycofactocin system GMC family oxidoreductase MftG n=1 Tax=Williamsia sp. TaxID=1872085 RepID=UPI001A1F8287|nr:mycofactocin system GMC family oxidoreductase MftG [Williamsia sp.]MBJ7287706.1 mycofactocin system GMC family oxidoreductase MftG [Williamsia sp.]
MNARRRIVVVGAGSCGCVVAERLTRDDDIEVILLEAGPSGAADADLRLSVLPIGASSDRVTHHRDASGLGLPRGQGLGGSSAVNGGYFMRWHDDDFIGWEQQRWDPDTVTRAYDELDGGPHGGGVMSVRRLADDELHPVAHAFEKYWQEAGYDVVESVSPRVGVNRVRSNSVGALRMPADRGPLGRARGRGNLSVRTGARVERLEVAGARVSGVRLADGETIAAHETILCAGTLASAALIARSTGVGATHRIAEHRELLVRCALTDNAHATPRPLLPTVLHTEDFMEIRCYNGDFAHYIEGLAPTASAIGVALMAPRTVGTLTIDETGRQQVDLGTVDPSDVERMRSWARRVQEMVTGPAFSGLLDPGTATVDETILTSQHAWGSMPMGRATDWLGVPTGFDGLRVIDGSILPTPGSSGPHETQMMMASTIVDAIVTEAR